MNRARFFLFIFLVLILQVSFFRKIKIYNAQPDFLLITVIYFGLFQNYKAGFFAGLCCGFLEDVFSFNPFWVNTFLFALLGLIMGFISGKLYKRTLKSQILLTIVSCIIIGLVFDGLTKVSSDYNFKFSFFFMILPGSLYTGLAAPAVIFILAKLFKPLSV